MNPSRALLGLCAAAVLSTASCGVGPVLRARARGIESTAARAEAHGAKRCAPRELAMAKAHLRFATIDLEQGQSRSAREHLAIAAPHARAALDLSPIGPCQAAGPKVGDRDGDGIPDDKDKCPDEPENYNGFEDGDGCPDDPDTDGDGIPDSLDACVLEPEDKDGFEDDDGCPDPDNDGDGILDAADKCPNEPEDLDGFQDEDGCPDPDNDGDTVPDVDDMCPNTPGQPGGDRPGCPGFVAVTAKEIRITEQIQFAFGRATIRKASYPVLDAVVDVLKANPKIRLELQGHTDNVGSAARNLKLSASRATAVRTYLATHGVDAGRLEAKGYGMTRPLLPNSSKSNRAVNRRVQFIRIEAPAPTP